jgi:hypothetical protein
MKRVTIKPQTLNQGAQVIVLLVLLVVRFSLFSQSETGKMILPTDTIFPFSQPVDNSVNLQLTQATPVGDINGDGLIDFVFKAWTADERTANFTDNIMKSVITTGSLNNLNEIIFYDSDVHGIGDFDGDGYDDLLDIRNRLIRFGDPQGVSNDSLLLNYPSHFTTFYYAGDINNDGMSEFIVGNYSGDSIYLFSGFDTVPVFLKITTLGWYCRLDDMTTLFHAYDYDMDGDFELCISDYDNYYKSRYFKWLYFDKENHTLILEKTTYIPFIHEPSPHYTNGFSDLNGDGLKDAVHAYYEYDTIDSIPAFHLEVNFGIANDPYFSNPIEIPVGNLNRILYNGGDFNGDGCDDWFSRLLNDTIVVYYGNQNIQNTGFQKEYYYTGDNNMMLLKTNYEEFFYSVGKMQVIDYNNDSIADLFFNYWRFDEHLRFDIIGTAIVLGGDNPDFEDPIIIGKTGAESFQKLQYGYNIKRIGDINKDGYDDFGILALSGCYLDIFFGGSIPDLEPDIRFLLPQTAKAECFDWSFGDLNGDGWIDIAISNSSSFYVRFSRHFMTERNEVYIFYGGPDLQGTYHYSDADVILSDYDTFFEFGKNICIVGDYNADGFDDLVVGGGQHKNSLRSAFLYWGGAQLGPEPDIVINVQSASNYSTFADPIVACGDINGDGYDDFTMGDPSLLGGKSLIFYGGPNAVGMYNKTIFNPVTGGKNFGRITPRTKGDFNGDGHPDLAYYNYSSREIFIYYGGPGFNQYPNKVIQNDDFSLNFSCLEFIDKSMETGASDLVVGSSSNGSYDFWVYSGGSFQSQQVDYYLGNSLHMSGITIASGDFNNDGYTDIVAGIPYERNYGNPNGGVALLYSPSIFVTDNNHSDINNQGLKVFPNPAKKEFNLSFSVENNSPIEISIIDLNGKFVYSEHLSNVKPGNQIIKVSTEGWKPGIYVCIIQTREYIIHQKVSVIN